MAKIEDLLPQAGGDWGGIDQINETIRVGHANNFLLWEKTLADGSVGVYPLPFIEEEHFESFLAWKATLPQK